MNKDQKLILLLCGLILSDILSMGYLYYFINTNLVNTVYLLVINTTTIVIIPLIILFGFSSGVNILIKHYSQNNVIKQLMRILIMLSLFISCFILANFILIMTINDFLDTTLVIKVK